MAMTSQLYTLNGLATETGFDRRSLGKWLDDLRPEKVDANGVKFWRLASVLEHVRRRNTPPSTEQGVRDELQRWLAHEMLPAILGSETFIKTFSGALRAEIGLNKPETLRVYMLLLLALVAELEHAGINCGIALPPLAERIAKEGVDAVAASWPDSHRG